ncbi:MAG: hypothetical protein RL154_786 [Pseudomonadota bacterium]|jgi:phage major head subunit gpT-like protein
MATFEETSVGFKSVFQKTYNDTAADAGELATDILSNDLIEKYTWLGNFPNMAKWIGERNVEALKDYGYTIENQLFEASISVPNLHIEYDKVGLYKPAIQQMAQNAKLFGSILVAEVLIAGHTNLCYDNKPFFAANHAIGEDTFSNIGTGVLNSTNLIAAKAHMMRVTSDNGTSLRVNPNIVVCGPQNLANVVAAIDKQLTTAGESNTTYQMFKYIVLPEITGMEWYLMDNTKAIKAFVRQIAKDAVFEASDINKFMKDAALFGVKSFMNVGYGLWQLAYKSSGVA